MRSVIRNGSSGVYIDAKKVIEATLITFVSKLDYSFAWPHKGICMSIGSVIHN